MLAETAPLSYRAWPGAHETLSKVCHKANIARSRSGRCQQGHPAAGHSSASHGATAGILQLKWVRAAPGSGTDPAYLCRQTAEPSRRTMQELSSLLPLSMQMDVKTPKALVCSSHQPSRASLRTSSQHFSQEDGTLHVGTSLPSLPIRTFLTAAAVTMLSGPPTTTHVPHVPRAAAKAVSWTGKLLAW